MQCIFATPILNDYFLKEYRKNGQQKLSYAYSELIKQVKGGQESTITPSDLKYAISKIAPQFSGYGQQDAQEFLRFFLNGLHEELNCVGRKAAYKELDFDRLPLE